MQRMELTFPEKKETAQVLDLWKANQELVLDLLSLRYLSDAHVEMSATQVNIPERSLEEK